MTFQTFFGHDIDFSKAATMFTIHHYIYIAIAFLAVFLTLRYAKVIHEKYEKQVKRIVIVLLIVLEIAYHIHNWTFPRTSVPLHICSFAVFINIALMLTNKKVIWNYAIFFGVSGGFMALTFPTSYGYTYLNFRYYHFMLLHFTIITVPIYYYKAYGYRFTYKTLLTVFKHLLVTGIGVYIMNGFLKTNYWFINEIPANVEFVFTNYYVYIISVIMTAFTSMNIIYLFTNFSEIKTKWQTKRG